MCVSACFVTRTRDVSVPELSLHMVHEDACFFTYLFSCRGVCDENQREQDCCGRVAFQLCWIHLFQMFVMYGYIWIAKGSLSSLCIPTKQQHSSFVYCFVQSCPILFLIVQAKRTLFFWGIGKTCFSFCWIFGTLLCVSFSRHLNISDYMKFDIFYLISVCGIKASFCFSGFDIMVSL